MFHSILEWEPIYHPMHLHGHRMVVTEINNGSSTQPGSKPNNFPPYKDTVAVPSTGHAVIRFRADNPGQCYIEKCIHIYTLLYSKVVHLSFIYRILDVSLSL